MDVCVCVCVRKRERERESRAPRARCATRRAGSSSRVLRGLSSTGGTSAAIEQLRGRGRKGKERSIRAPVWRSRCCRPLSSGEGLNIERSRLARPPRERSSVPIPSTLSLPPPSSPFAPRSVRAAHPPRRQRAGVTTQTRQYVISLAPLPRHAITLVPMLFTPLRRAPSPPIRLSPTPSRNPAARWLHRRNHRRSRAPSTLPRISEPPPPTPCSVFRAFDRPPSRAGTRLLGTELMRRRMRSRLAYAY